MTTDLEQRDENISRMGKEKKQLEQVNQQTLEDLQAMEDKANHLGKLKIKLEQQVEDVRMESKILFPKNSDKFHLASSSFYDYCL